MTKIPLAIMLATLSIAGSAQTGGLVKKDFVAAEKIFYYENFEQEAIGKFPAGWNTNGTGEVTLLDKYPGKWLRLHEPFTYLTANQQQFGENYTIEFDIVLQLKNNPGVYPQVSFALFSLNTASGADNEKGYNKYGCVTALFSPGEIKSSKAGLKSYVDGKSFFTATAKPLAELAQWYGQPVHMAIQVQKERFRMWANDIKIFDAPKAVPMNYIMNQLQIRVHGINDNETLYGIYISNIKMAR